MLRVPRPDIDSVKDPDGSHHGDLRDGLDRVRVFIPGLLELSKQAKETRPFMTGTDRS